LLNEACFTFEGRRYLEIKICVVTLDSITQIPLVLLKDSQGDHTLPIWMHTVGAVSINAELISRDVLLREKAKIH
jgi:bifunctional DNase/RNase